MGITLTKKNFLIWKTISTILAGLLVGGAIKLFWPTHYFSWFPFIPLYFYIFGWYYIYMFDYCRRYTPHKLLSVYMGMKVVKMLLSMIILLIYVLHVKVHKEDFVLTFFLFYLFSMIYESYFFCLFEHNLKKKLKNKGNE